MLFHEFCNDLLGDKKRIEKLRMQKFDVVLVDLIYNECGLALAHELGVPTVGYWAFSFSSGEAEFR